MIWVNSGGPKRRKLLAAILVSGAVIVGGSVVVHHNTHSKVASSQAAVAGVATSPSRLVQSALSADGHTQPSTPVPKPLPAPAPPPPAYIGLFVSEAPGDPDSFTTLDWAHSIGFNLVLNYSSINGTSTEITAYLNHAQNLGMKVIFSLKDLYDGLTPANSNPQFGTSNEAVAIKVASLFGNHPATWGFDITDEAPETPADLPKWSDTLKRRYKVIKAVTSKPVMSVLIGESDGQAAARRNFLSALRPSTDTYALDYYPVPYEAPSNVGTYASDLPAIGDTNGWSIIQAFSWAQYPDMARSLGYNVSVARAPTAQEMSSMAKLALTHGARNLLFYSYFDIKDNPAQQAALKTAIALLR